MRMSLNVPAHLDVYKHPKLVMIFWTVQMDQMKMIVKVKKQMDLKKVKIKIE